MPHINKSIRRQPFNSIWLARIIHLLRVTMRRWVQGQYILSDIREQPKRAILNDVVQLETLNPLAFNSTTEMVPDHSNIAERLTATWRIHPIGVHQKRRVYRHRRALAINRESHLKRVQFDVAALEGEEEEEGARENREQRKFHIHDEYTIASEDGKVKRTSGNGKEQE